MGKKKLYPAINYTSRDFNSIKNDLILKSDSKIKKISILFKKIEKND